MDTIKIIKSLEKSIIDDQKNVNNLIDLLSYLENDNPKVLLKCIGCLQRSFIFLIQKNSLIFKQNVLKEKNYLSWMQDRYEDTVNFLCEKLTYEIFKIANLTLDTLLCFIKAEAKINKSKKLNYLFFNKILEKLLQPSDQENNKRLILTFTVYLKFDDVRYATMKCLLKIVENSEMDRDLLFLILTNLHSPKKLKKDEKDSHNIERNYFALNIKDPVYLNSPFEKDQQKLFTDLWISFIKKNHSTQRFQLIIACLAEKVMPFMSSPILLADILTNAYNCDGSIRLLALNGIFILINDYNLQYPDFYGKLYRILQPNVLSEKYRPRFFYLLDLFLSSTHLPSYLVCAFIKRLSRLSIKCPTPALSCLYTMIINLLIRHPSCQYLVNRTSNGMNLNSDPYLENEMDPSKCKASESSLWELQTLQNHFHHGLAIELRSLNDQLPPHQLQINNLYDLSYDEIFLRERKKKKVPTATLR